MTASYNKWASILDLQTYETPITGSYTGSIDPFIEGLDSSSVNVFKNNEFPSLLPISMKVAAQTIGLNLVNVQPLGGNSKEELERIKGEVTQENRDRSIDSLLEDKEFKPMKVEEHPDYNKGPKMDLLYLDFKYGGTSSNDI